jgi:hypothetical protein
MALDARGSQRGTPFQSTLLTCLRTRLRQAGPYRLTGYGDKNATHALGMLIQRLVAVHEQSYALDGQAVLQVDDQHGRSTLLN